MYFSSRNAQMLSYYHKIFLISLTNLLFITLKISLLQHIKPELVFDFLELGLRSQNHCMDSYKVKLYSPRLYQYHVIHRHVIRNPIKLTCLDFISNFIWRNNIGQVIMRLCSKYLEEGNNMQYTVTHIKVRKMEMDLFYKKGFIFCPNVPSMVSQGL